MAKTKGTASWQGGQGGRWQKTPWSSHEDEWELFISAKPFKFFISSTTHVRKLEARANLTFGFYGMRPKFWWCTLYSSPMEEVSYLDCEYRY